MLNRRKVLSLLGGLIPLSLIQKVYSSENTLLAEHSPYYMLQKMLVMCFVNSAYSYDSIDALDLDSFFCYSTEYPHRPQEYGWYATITVNRRLDNLCYGLDYIVEDSDTHELGAYISMKMEFLSNSEVESFSRDVTKLFKETFKRLKANPKYIDFLKEEINNIDKKLKVYI